MIVLAPLGGLFIFHWMEVAYGLVRVTVGRISQNLGNRELNRNCPWKCKSSDGRAWASIPAEHGGAMGGPGVTICGVRIGSV